ncbi:hypothetical protein EW026_g6411 [Hermanssonia centrifuga]|uniref:mRNA export factor GLE1 n=1 Tax=Hermanssonia centrifuga TaxID=98765 RepID=A0A4S4KB53_9APHY|nr:hypothetical protein EW026_g6411 [Hermanssonia centrifuga]
MLASIKLRVTHHDVYEEWEQQTRKDAFLSARHEQAVVGAARRQSQAAYHSELSSTRASLHKKQADDIQSKLNIYRSMQQMEEAKMREGWKERDRQLWERVERVIKMEEDKVKVKLEAERRRQQEEERRRKEVEERLKQEEERKQQALEKKRKEEEEKRQMEAREEEVKRQQLELEKQRVEQEQAEQEERKAIGLTTAAEDWRRGREMLKKLKSGPMAIVKADKSLKSLWSAGRRQITPKIGQLTNDAQAIGRISQQIVDIIRPSPMHSPPVYFALLSSLAKAILLQAETEVTAEKRSAIPLAQVTANLLGALEGFADIFWAKLCQRAGGWPIPAVVPTMDVDRMPFDDATRRKALGYRSEDESLSDYNLRVSGMMRVYFHVLSAPVAEPLDARFRLPRYWTYFARMLSSPQLLETSVAAEVLYVGLDVNGAMARDVWGGQWLKLMGILYEGATTGLYGSEGRLIGGKSPEGIAARVRVQLEIERLLKIG